MIPYRNLWRCRFCVFFFLSLSRCRLFLAIKISEEIKKYSTILVRNEEENLLRFTQTTWKWVLVLIFAIESRSLFFLTSDTVNLISLNIPYDVREDEFCILFFFLWHSYLVQKFLICCPCHTATHAHTHIHYSNVAKFAFAGADSHTLDAIDRTPSRVISFSFCSNVALRNSV